MAARVAMHAGSQPTQPTIAGVTSACSSHQHHRGYPSVYKQGRHHRRPHSVRAFLGRKPLIFHLQCPRGDTKRKATLLIQLPPPYPALLTPLSLLTPRLTCSSVVDGLVTVFSFVICSGSDSFSNNNYPGLRYYLQPSPLPPPPL